MSVSELRPAYRVRGPSAGGGDPRRFWNLAMTLARSDWKVRFFGSALGYVWSLLRPLMLFGILYFVFAEVVKAGAGVDHYPVALLLAMMLHFYFAEVTGVCVTSMVDRETLLRKVGFPRGVVPLAVSIGATMNLGLNLIVLTVFVALSGVDPQWTWLLLPIPFVLMMTLASGAGMLLSALYVTFRDIKPIWEVVLQALFYATPVLYPIELVIRKSQDLATISLCNPMAAIIQEARYLLVGPDGSPSLTQAMDSTVLLIVPIVLAIVIVGLGLWVFDRLAPAIAEEL